MFLYGITSIEKIITENQQALMLYAIDQAYAKSKMHNEADGDVYKNSFGVSSLPELEPIFESLTATIEHVTKLKLERKNTYSRIYFDHGKLGKHVDRPGLDLTLSIQLENTTGTEWPIYAENYQGGTHGIALKDRDSLLLKGGDLEHWRDEMDIPNKNGRMVCVFFHWEIMSGEVFQQENVLDAAVCKRIIDDAEARGFDKSSVLQGGKNVIDPHYRNSSTLMVDDQYGIRDAINRTLPMFKDMIFEGWQLVKYEVGEEFKAHQDCLADRSARYFTVILYLNQDFTGGYTLFNATGDIIIPETGKLAVWKNVSRLDCSPKSMHEGKKVKSGVKFVLVNWVKRKIQQ